MVVAGASRHAKEVIELLHERKQLDSLFFWDDVTSDGPELFYGRFTIVKHIDQLKEVFITDNQFILGLGGTYRRAQVANKLTNAGGQLCSIIASTARVGHFEVVIGSGVNIMEFALISNSVCIGEGSLINAFVALHHDVKIGSYCEISPRATLLGGVLLGDYCAVGSGAIILPNLRIGSNVIIGAGSVVTKDIPDNSLVLGVPGRLVKKLASPAYRTS